MTERRSTPRTADPSPEDISAACLAIQSTWSPLERLARTFWTVEKVTHKENGSKVYRQDAPLDWSLRAPNQNELPAYTVPEGSLGVASGREREISHRMSLRRLVHRLGNRRCRGWPIYDGTRCAGPSRSNREAAPKRNGTAGEEGREEVILWAVGKVLGESHKLAQRGAIPRPTTENSKGPWHYAVGGSEPKERANEEGGKGAAANRMR